MQPLRILLTGATVAVVDVAHIAASPGAGGAAADLAGSAADLGAAGARARRYTVWG